MSDQRSTTWSGAEQEREIRYHNLLHASLYWREQLVPKTSMSAWPAVKHLLQALQAFDPQPCPHPLRWRVMFPPPADLEVCGYCGAELGMWAPMTLNKQQKDQLKQQFPGVTDEELSGDPSALADAIAARTGQDRAAVEQSIANVTGEAGQQGGQGQRQS